MYLSYYIPLLYSTYSTTFINYIEENMFLDMKKISNICPIHEKGDIQAINNFRLVFALPMLGRLFKRLIFNCLFVYLEERRLLSAYQFGWDFFYMSKAFVKSDIMVLILNLNQYRFQYR